MNSVLHLDAEARTVRVEPGMTVTALNMRCPIRPHVGAGPRKRGAARTIGGSVANNATAATAFSMACWPMSVLETGADLADGAVRFGTGGAGLILVALARQDGLYGQIYAAFPAIGRGARWSENLARLAQALAVGTSGYNSRPAGCRAPAARPAVPPQL